MRILIEDEGIDTGLPYSLTDPISFWDPGPTTRTGEKEI